MTASRANLQECASVAHKDYRDVSHCNFSIDAFQLIYHHRKHLSPSPSAFLLCWYLTCWFWGGKKLTQILLYLLAFTEGHIKTWCSGALQCLAASDMYPESGWRRNRYVFGKSRNYQCHWQFHFTKSKTLMGFKLSQPSTGITCCPPSHTHCKPQFLR